MKPTSYTFTEAESELYEAGNDIAIRLAEAGFENGMCELTPSACRQINVDGDCDNCNLLKLLNAHNKVLEER